MKQTLQDNSLLKLSEFIASNLALSFPKERWNDLERNIINASLEFGYRDTEKFITKIISSPLTREHSEILASHLTINETYFWREPETFEALEQKIIPELIRQKRKGDKRIRIWSVGCSSGEEPYSIAMALHRAIPDISNWNISILATDINQSVLSKAIAGKYRQWSFRREPKWLKEKYFLQNENVFEIIPLIKKMVRFEYLNLAEDIFPSSINNTNAMDIIYCRNVLMYFTPERFRQIGHGLYNSLLEGGYLVVSASELSMHNFPDFIPVKVQGMVFYQKTSKKNKDKKKNTHTEVQPESLLFPIPPATEQTYEIFKSTQTEANIKTSESLLLQDVPVYKESLDSYIQGNYSDVIDKLEKPEQTSEEQILVIRAYANQGKISEALGLCKESITTHKLNQYFYFLYATILQENNQPDEAIASLKRAIYLNPDFALSYFSLGSIYKQQGKMNLAKKCFENILNILNKLEQEDVLFESEGLTAGRLREIVNANLIVKI